MDQRVSRSDIKGFPEGKTLALVFDIMDETYLASEELFAIYGP